MKPENLFESIEHVDEKDLEHSESKRVFRPWWAVAAAAALVVMVGLGVLLRPWFGSAPLQTAAIRQAQYPEMPAYPDENDTDFDSQWDAWWEAKQASRQEEGLLRQPGQLLGGSACPLSSPGRRGRTGSARR